MLGGMDSADDAPLKYYDRHAEDRSPAPQLTQRPARRFFVGADGIGLFLPVWLLVVALPIAMPIGALTNGASGAGTAFAVILFYGGIVASYLMVPYGGAYLTARLLSVFILGRLNFVAVIIWSAVPVLLMATQVPQGWLWIALPGVSGLGVSSAVRIRTRD